MNKRNLVAAGLVGLLSIGFFGCNLPRYETRCEPTRAEATVTKRFIAGDDGIATGLALDNMALGLASSTPDEYIVSLDLGNEILKVDSSQWYKAFENNDRVIVDYCPEYRIEFRDLDEDGVKDDFVGEEFVKYKVLDVLPR